MLNICQVVGFATPEPVFGRLRLASLPPRLEPEPETNKDPPPRAPLHLPFQWCLIRLLPTSRRRRLAPRPSHPRECGERLEQEREEKEEEEEARALAPPLPRTDAPQPLPPPLPRRLTARSPKPPAGGRQRTQVLPPTSRGQSEDVFMMCTGRCTNLLRASRVCI